MTIAEKIQQVAENSEAIANNELRVYEAGQEKGKQDERNEFWDYFQNFGKKTDYGQTFLDWHEKNFYPKYDIKPSTAVNMFRIQRQFFDLVERLNECGIVLDFSNCTSMNAAFQYAHMYRLPTIDTRSSNSNITQTFRYIYGCHTIDKVILRNDGTQKFNQTFEYLTDLVNIAIEGVIGQDGFNVQWSTKLSKDSITSIINALSPDTSGLTVTLSLAAVNTAFESGAGAGDGSNTPEWAALEASKSNWTISLV